MRYQRKLTPCRFKPAPPDDKVIFNGIVAPDLAWRNTNSMQKRKSPVLHVIDIHIHFQNSLFLKGEAARHVWDVFIDFWSTLYVGYSQNAQDRSWLNIHIKRCGKTGQTWLV